MRAEGRHVQTLCALTREGEPMALATTGCSCGADPTATQWLQELVRHAIVWRRNIAGTNGVATSDVLICARCSARARDLRHLMHRRDCVVGQLLESAGIPTTFVPF